MKTLNLKIIFLGVLAFWLSACGLNSSEEGSLVANQIRGSGNGQNLGSLQNGGKAIDLPVGRPEPTSDKWTYAFVTERDLENYLSMVENQRVDLSSRIFSSVETFFWGDMNSSQGVLRLGNPTDEQEYFTSLDKNNFQFEITIWDLYTDQYTDETKTEKYDYLGYAYFARGNNRAVGTLSDVVYCNNGRGTKSTCSNTSGTVVALKFSDSVGDIILEGQLLRNSQALQTRMTGRLLYRAKGQAGNPYVLGSFSNLKVCQFFKCGS